MRNVLSIGLAGSKGKGVFAASRIRRGTLLVRYSGRAKWIWDIPENLWDHCVQVGYDRYVVPRRSSYGWYLNHSCDPNCFIRNGGEIVAMRDIEKGEEITFDYSTNVGWDGFAMKCSCGSGNCRKVVWSYWHLGRTVRERYGKNVSSYLIERRP